MIILTLAPGDTPYPLDWFPDLFVGNTRRIVPYTNSPLNNGPANAAAGAATLNAMLPAAITDSGAEACVVIGHSMGAQVIYKWFRDYGPSASFDPADIVFISTGNFERKYNGAVHIPGANLFGIPIVAQYGGVGIPENTPYRIYDIAKQYEFFADHPNNRSNSTAVNNALSGFIYHGDYSGINILSDHIDAPAEGPNGNIHYGVVRSYPVASLWGIRWLTWYTKYRDRTLRPIIESAYTRPVTIP